MEELRDVKTEPESSKIDETNRRVDEIAKTLSQRVDETNKRIDTLTLEVQRQFTEVNMRIDGLAKRVEALQTTLLKIQKL